MDCGGDLLEILVFTWMLSPVRKVIAGSGWRIWDCEFRFSSDKVVQGLRRDPDQPVDDVAKFVMVVWVK